MLWNEEQVFYSENGEPLSGQPVSFALTNLQPPTPAFFTTHILELATGFLLFPTPNHGPSQAQIPKVVRDDILCVIQT
ncbi:hypothetical protein Y696_00125 [Mesotoga sp. H07pep.5.4]|nr:hypothetical protein Y696_00125 [Mesotoga sp. H07pep.5.4]